MARDGRSGEDISAPRRGRQLSFRRGATSREIAPDLPPPSRPAQSRGMTPRLVFALALLLGWYGRAAEPRPPLAHAHNDYEHPRPLLDALARGFDSVEADVWLVDGELLVAHDRRDVRPGRDLRTLYLEPLRARVRAGGGAVHAGRPDFVLLVDVKSAAAPTYAAVAAALADYAEILTEFVEGRAIRWAVTVIMSGNRDEAALRAAPRRWAAISARALMPLT